MMDPGTSRIRPEAPPRHATLVSRWVGCFTVTLRRRGVSLLALLGVFLVLLASLSMCGFTPPSRLCQVLHGVTRLAADPLLS